MSIPTKCSVLVVGGGPAGSYAASVLAREGIDTVVLESETFPRYHVGESMLPSLRHFLRFIDLDSTFDSYGFQIKKGATFKLNNTAAATHTHFVAAGGPNAYTWNVVRSEADHLLFKHAGESGAQVFDGVKVRTLAFSSPTDGQTINYLDTSQPTHPVSADWSRKDGSSGRIEFDQLVDASGRYGLMSCKYLKNRNYNQGLKHMANWAYWKGAHAWGTGISEEGYPYFEHLQDKSGWIWFIPLHNGTTSVGVVMKQEAAVSRKKAMNSPEPMQFYLRTIATQCPGIKDLLADAEVVGGIHAASDWSYSASTYSSPNVRIVGDAGCFIDPFFSSGVHIALTTALSAATTIASVRKGECNERMAGRWHTAKVQEVYTRFYIVVSSAITQIREGDVNILNDINETGFNTAFAHFRPIIHGTADIKPEMTQEQLSKILKFVSLAFHPTEKEEQEAVLEKVSLAKLDGQGLDDNGTDTNGIGEILTPQEMEILGTLRGRELIRHEDILDLGAISSGAIHGLAANVKRGSLGLVPSSQYTRNQSRKDGLGLMLGERPLHQYSAPATDKRAPIENEEGLVASAA